MKERKKGTGLPFLVTCEIPKASKRDVHMMRVNKLPFLKQSMSFDHHSCAWIFLCCYKYDYHWLLGSGQESAGVCWNMLLALDNYYWSLLHKLRGAATAHDVAVGLKLVVYCYSSCWPWTTEEYLLKFDAARSDFGQLRNYCKQCR